MKKPLIIFGGGDIAELAFYYFETDSEYEVVAFTVDPEYVGEGDFCGLPIISFDEIEKEFQPDSHDIFVALSYSGVNSLRKEKFMACKKKGYRLASYLSSKACVFNTKIGENCFILENNVIQPFVTIGDNVTLWSGNHIGHHSVIHDHVFIASHVVVSGGVEIFEQVFIGVNATLRDHIKIGKKSVIGAGVLLLGDIDPDSVYIGTATEKSRVPSYRLKKI